MQQDKKLSTSTLDRIKRKINEIKDAPEGVEYIYRGEAKRHDEVCSGLYREYMRELGNNEREAHDIEGSQKALLDKIKTYLPDIGDDDSEILAQLQHYRAKTNLIDFTPNHLIALYFACEKEMESDGRVILLQRPKNKEDEEEKGYKVIEPPEIIERIKSQKSIFVESLTGVIKPDDIITIPKEIKEDMLTYLHNKHNISREFIYKDIHGFIESKDIKIQYLELHKGHQEKEFQIKHKKYEERDYSKAIDHIEIALMIEPEFPEAYSELGEIYSRQNKSDKSIENFNKAIEYDPDNARYYHGIGTVCYHSDKFEEAIEFYNIAIEKNSNESYSYYGRCKSRIKIAVQNEEMWEDVRKDINTLREQFENLNSIKQFINDEKIVPPDDIRIMLRLPQQED